MAAIAHSAPSGCPVWAFAWVTRPSARSTAGWCAASGAGARHANKIRHDGHGALPGLHLPFTATRYHSLVVDEALPDCLELSGWNATGLVMGVRHRELPVHGVQFHPESVLTSTGMDLLRNFLVLRDGRDAPKARALPAS